jgi:exocyst complex component 2
MYEALLYLVGIHSQVTVVAKNLLERTMNALVEDVASEGLTCFQQVKKFGMGGMLRVRFHFFPSHNNF